MIYTNFHQHSHFSNTSFLDGYGTVDQIVARCKEIGYKTVALTDHWTVWGHIELIRACKDQGLKPACGCEMYLVDSLEDMIAVKEKKPIKDKEMNESDENLSYEEVQKAKARTKFHFNVIAKNQEGLIALWKLVSKSWNEGFYYRPTISWAEIEKHKENLWISSACEIGPLWRIIESVKQEKLQSNGLEDTEENENLWRPEAKEKLKERLLELWNKFGESFYVEIIPVPDKRARWKYLMIYEVAKELGCLIICTNDSHAPRKEDTIFQDMIYCAGQRRSDPKVRYNDPERNKYTEDLFYIHSAEEMFERMTSVFPEIPENEILQIMNNTSIIEEGIQIVEEPRVPAVAYSDINDTEDIKLNLYTEVQRLIKKGWAFRWIDKLPIEDQKRYAARMKREFEVISNKGYIDYFLIFADIMDWCETDRPLIENFDLWMDLNAESLYPWKTKEEIKEILEELKYFDKKDPIATGIARGSAGWSLITYLLRITNIDPMPGDLLFERFIDYTRGNVYYQLDFDTYTKEQFLKEYPKEDLERLKVLKDSYRDWFKKKNLDFLKENDWYDPIQVKREFWLLSHNQQFSREEEYFFTLLDKKQKGEINISNKNESHSILSYIGLITSKLVKEDYVVNLTDIPDIDTDFEDARRQEVYLYLRNRYGYHNSSRIATYTVLKDKSAIDLLERIFPSEEWRKEASELKDFIEEYKKENDIAPVKSLKSKHIDDFLSKVPLNLRHIEYLKYIGPLLWQVVAFGMHPAGIIVHNNKITNYGAVYQNRNKDTGLKESVLCWDCGVAESMGLMKLDILWLNTVTNLKTINKLVEKRHGFEHHWQRIPGMEEDTKTKELMASVDWRGLFQLEGSTMMLLWKVVKPDTLEKISFVGAWGRPGPLDSAMKYGELKEGSLQPNYFGNKIYEDITKDNYGILIYQEEIMRLSRELCGYDDAMVWKIRKLVSKSKLEELKKLEPDFIKRAVEHWGMEEWQAKALWDSITNFWRYAFNKSHSAAYGLLWWIGGYYKANYQIEFYTGMLQTLNQVSGKVVGTDKDKVFQLLKDYKAHWYKVLNPTINESRETFSINVDEETWNEAIRIGLNYIKGVGPKPCKNIVENQPFENYEDFLAKVDRRVVNARVVNACQNMGLFNLIGWAPNLDVKLVPSITHLEDTKEIIETILILIDDFSLDLYEKLLTLWAFKEDAIEKDLEDKREKEEYHFTINDFKKIKTKANSRLKSIITKTRSEEEIDWKIKKAGAIETKRNYENDLLMHIENLNEAQKELLRQDKHYKKNKAYLLDYDSEAELSELENIVEIIQNGISSSKTDECMCWKEEHRECANIFEGLKIILGNIDTLLSEIVDDLGFSKEKVIIKPTYKEHLEYCPILAEADLTKYKHIVPYLDNFQPLRNVDFRNDLYSAVFIGILVEKRILPDAEDRKMKCMLSLVVWEYKKNVFVSGNAFLNNESSIRWLQVGDAVIMKGSARAGNFHMISLNQCDSLKKVYDHFLQQVTNKKRKVALTQAAQVRQLTQEENFFLENFDNSSSITQRERWYFKI